MNHLAAWSSEHVELAIALHDRHFSAQLAADEFFRLTHKRITRCAMIGKWHRLGLRADKELAVKKARPVEKKKAVRRMPSPPLLPPSPSKIEPKLSLQPCTLVELRFHDQCRWPISDTRSFPVYYCGAQREFSGDEGRHKYCCFHARQAFAGKGRP